MNIGIVSCLNYDSTYNFYGTTGMDLYGINEKGYLPKDISNLELPKNIGNLGLTGHNLYLEKKKDEIKIEHWNEMSKGQRRRAYKKVKKIKKEEEEIERNKTLSLEMPTLKRQDGTHDLTGTEFEAFEYKKYIGSDLGFFELEISCAIARIEDLTEKISNYKEQKNNFSKYENQSITIGNNPTPEKISQMLYDLNIKINTLESKINQKLLK